MPKKGKPKAVSAGDTRLLRLRQGAEEARRAHQEKIRPLSPQIHRDAQQGRGPFDSRPCREAKTVAVQPL